MNIKEKVYNYPTKHREGFLQSEIEELLKEYPNIDMEKFNSSLWGNTCMIKDDEMVQYHCDIEMALLCGIEKRDLRNYEWD
jgi:hypothetical protein